MEKLQYEQARTNSSEAVTQKGSVKRCSGTGKSCRLTPATLLKKILWNSCFSVNFARILRATFL